MLTVLALLISLFNGVLPDVAFYAAAKLKGMLSLSLIPVPPSFVAVLFVNPTLPLVLLLPIYCSACPTAGPVINLVRLVKVR